MAAHGLPREQMLERRRIQGVDYAVFEMPGRQNQPPALS